MITLRNANSWLSSSPGTSLGVGTSSYASAAWEVEGEAEVGETSLEEMKMEM